MINFVSKRIVVRTGYKKQSSTPDVLTVKAEKDDEGFDSGSAHDLKSRRACHRGAKNTGLARVLWIQALFRAYIFFRSCMKSWNPPA